MWEMLRSKNFLILILFILATSISIWLVTMPTPNIQNIMKETHKQINNLKNMNMMSINNEEKDQKIDDTYLELLGFVKSPQLYPAVADPEISLPIIVTGVTSRNYQKAYQLIDSVKKYLSDKQMLIYDLGLGSYELVKLQKRCNETTSCTVKSFDFDKFPKHLRDMDKKAFKPIAIQDALNKYGAVIWTDLNEYFITSDINPILKSVQTKGIGAWTIDSEDATSAFTHPKMFDYFKTRQDNYMFHRMVDSNHLIIYNTEQVHKKLMLPWVECALQIECIWPTGAQNVGCNYSRKPKYKYSGCHKYEISALNVVLGLMFDFDDQEYTLKYRIFGIETPEEEEVENSTVKQYSKKNQT